jgi:hypothetical protein
MKLHHLKNGFKVTYGELVNGFLDEQFKTQLGLNQALVNRYTAHKNERVRKN